MTTPRTVPLDASLRLASRLVIATIVCAFLYWGRSLLIPVALAAIIGFMLNPAVKAIRRVGLPQVPAVFLATFGFAGVMLGLFLTIGSQVVSFAQELPNYRDNIRAKVTDFRTWIHGGSFQKLQSTVDAVVAPTPPPKSSGRVAKSDTRQPMTVMVAPQSSWFNLQTATSAAHLVEFFVTAGLVFLLVFLMLLQWSDLRSRLMGFLQDKVTLTTRALDEAGTRIRRYLGMQLLLNTALGVCIGGGLFVLGVPYAALWGLCAGVLHYIPYAGPVIAAILPLLVSLVTSNGWQQPASVAGLFIVIELINNNVCEPWLYGSRLGISEIGVVLSTVAWTFLWGPVGLVVALPLTACLVVMGEYVPSLSFFSQLLGHETVNEPHFRLYQRLLAKDSQEVEELLKRAAHESGWPAVYETLAVPCLALARREQAAGRLSGNEAQAMSELLPRLLPPVPQDAAEPVPRPERFALIVPACGFSEHAAHLFVHQLDLPPGAAVVLPGRLRVPEVVSYLRALPQLPEAVCLVQLHAADITRFRALSRQLRSAFPRLPLLLAHWAGEPPESDEKQERQDAILFDRAGTFSGARVWLHRHVPPAPAPAAPAADAPAPGLLHESPVPSGHNA